MKDKIKDILKQLEVQHECRIILAVESGSRAWGFASPDSDYDVRVVYVKPLELYLGLEEKLADTWSAMLPDDIDVSAWDLRKALRQLLKSNAAFLEWLGSPIVYRDDGLLKRLSATSAACVNPVRLAYHYASMFHHAMDDSSEDGMIGVKKLCYALRANLCVQWVLEHGTMPPTQFADVCAGINLQDSQQRSIERLLALKATANEKDRIQPESDLMTLLMDHQATLASVKWPKTVQTCDPLKELESIFRSYVAPMPGIVV